MRPIGAPGQTPDRFYVISLADFCGLRHRRLSWRNLTSDEERRNLTARKRS